MAELDRKVRAEWLLALPMMLSMACGPSIAANDPDGGHGGGGTELVDGGAITGCAEGIYPADVVPLDMYLLMDTSQSMLIGGAWEQTQAAIAEFVSVADPDGLSVGVGFFPLPPPAEPTCTIDADCVPYDGPCSWGECNGGEGVLDSCLVEDYAVPAVPTTPLPAAAGPIQSAMQGKTEYGNTPMAVALSGALSYVQAWASAHPAHLPVVVLTTDGMPTSCDPQGLGEHDRLPEVAAVASAGLAHSPSIKTFVVGFGMGDALRDIAAAGGTEAIDVSVSTVEEELFAALDEIRRDAACRYQIPPPPPGRDLDFDRVNVVHVHPDDSEHVIPKVESAAACGPQGGWHYDDEANPSHIVLCPATCDEIRTELGDVQVVLGCVTIVL